MIEWLGLAALAGAGAADGAKPKVARVPILLCWNNSLRQVLSNGSVWSDWQDSGFDNVWLLWFVGRDELNRILRFLESFSVLELPEAEGESDGVYVTRWKPEHALYLITPELDRRRGPEGQWIQPKHPSETKLWELYLEQRRALDNSDAAGLNQTISGLRALMRQASAESALKRRAIQSYPVETYALFSPGWSSSRAVAGSLSMLAWGSHVAEPSRRVRSKDPWGSEDNTFVTVPLFRSDLQALRNMWPSP